MKYRIHTKGDTGVTIYTTETDVAKQMQDSQLASLRFTDIKGVTIIISKEKIIRLIELSE